MDEAERAAIKEMHDDFLKNLHIDPEFLSPLIQEGVLEDSMVEDIQALPTQSRKIMQLLQDLPRCGHNAFDCFLEVLRKRSDWLANKLQEKYKEKSDQESYDDQTNENLHNGFEETGENNEAELHVLSEKELTPTISLSTPNSEVNSPALSLRSAGAVAIRYQRCLNHLYINLKNKIRKLQKRELSFVTPDILEPATFKMIENLHDELFEQLTEHQISADQCYRALGSNNDKVPLVSYVTKLKRQKADLERQLKASEDKRNKYCEQITKLDLKIRNQASEIQITEQKLNRILQNKMDQDMEFKDQTEELEEKLRKKAGELEVVKQEWQLKYNQLKTENEELRKALSDWHPNHYNRSGIKDNLQGLLQISNNHNKVNPPDTNDAETAVVSPRQPKTNNTKRPTDGLETGKDKLKQARIHRRQRRYEQYSSLSYLSSSRVHHASTTTETNESKQIDKTLENMSEINQMKLSLHNGENSKSGNSPFSHKPLNLQIPSIRLQKKDETEPKDSHTEKAQFSNKRGNKRQPLLRVLSSKDAEAENGTMAKRKNSVFP